MFQAAVWEGCLLLPIDLGVLSLREVLVRSVRLATECRRYIVCIAIILLWPGEGMVVLFVLALDRAQRRHILPVELGEQG